MLARNSLRMDSRMPGLAVMMATTWITAFSSEWGWLIGWSARLSITDRLSPRCRPVRARLQTQSWQCWPLETDSWGSDDTRRVHGEAGGTAHCCCREGGGAGREPEVGERGRARAVGEC